MQNPASITRFMHFIEKGWVKIILLSLVNYIWVLVIEISSWVLMTRFNTYVEQRVPEI